MALTDKLSAIADAIRGKTGGTEKLTLDQMPTEIAGIQAGGGGGEAVELLYETTFSVAESIPTTTKTTLATVKTGLSADDFENGSLYMVAIKCTNDTETDMSFSHFRERIQTLADAGSGYIALGNSSGVLYFYRADTDGITTYGGWEGGAYISSAGRYVATLTVTAKGSMNSGGYAVSGDYSLKLYKVNIDFFGLEGLPDA